MPSPKGVAREPGRRVKKSNKPERREEQPVDTGDMDMGAPTPSQQSDKSGPGAGGGRERARRINERIPRAGGAKAHAKSKDTTMMDKDVEKKMRSMLRRGETPANLAAPENAVRKQPRRQGSEKQRRAAKASAKKAQPKRGAAPAEAAPTQKQMLRDKPNRRRTIRDEGVKN